MTAVPTPATTPPGPASARSRRAARRRRFTGAALAAPFALLLLCTVLIPIGYAFYLSLFADRLSGLGFDGYRQVLTGFDNYTDVLADPAARDSVANVARYAAIHIPVMFGGALLIALLLNSATVRLRQLWSLAVFLPYAVPGVIAGLIWGYLYSPGIGPLADVLPFDPFGESGVLPSIVNMATWQWTGYNVIIFYTALQTVPRDVLEAARADGAGALRTALSIKIPMIRPTIFVALVLPPSAPSSCSPNPWSCAPSPARSPAPGPPASTSTTRPSSGTTTGAPPPRPFCSPSPRPCSRRW